MLEQFWTVTVSGVYDMKAIGDGRASAIKIASGVREVENDIPVGMDIAEGHMVAICKWLQGYVPANGFLRPEIEKIKEGHWGKHTGPIVALFAKEADALACNRVQNARMRDPRWFWSTKWVLNEIRRGSYSFYVARRPDLVLLEPQQA